MRDLHEAARERYRQFSESCEKLPLFLRAWWLDATCGADGWGVSLAGRGTEIVGALPFLVRRRLGRNVLTQPMLTQFLGPWIGSSQGRHASKAARQKDIMEALIAGLPPHGHYAQSWSPDVTYWLPFYWAGFRQTTRYTMVLRRIGELDAVWQGLQANARTDIRKAETRFGVRLLDDASLEDFLEINGRTFARQGKVPPYDSAYVARLDEACRVRGCRKILIAADDQGRAHAGAYIVWGAGTTYYLMGGGDPNLRSSGATSFCLWQAIRFASTVGDAFDFEGSMMEPVERFFRSFGALHVPYSYVTRTPSRLFRLRTAIASLK